MFHIELKRKELEAELLACVPEKAMQPARADFSSFCKFNGVITNQIINDILQEAERKFSIYPIGIPKIQIQKSPDARGILIAMAFNILPEIKLPDYPERLNVDIEEAIVQPHEIRAQLHKILRVRGELVSVDKIRHPEPGDILIIDIEVGFNDKIIRGLSQNKITIQYKTQSKYGHIIEAVRRLTVGDSITVQGKDWPLDTIDAQYKKLISIKLTLVNIKKEILPKADDNFAKSLGISSLAALHASIYRKSLGVKFDLAKRSAMDHLLDTLLASNSFPLSENMLAQTLKDIKHSLQLQLLAKGCTQDDAEWELSLQKNFLRHEAEDVVRRQMLLLAAARKYDISITEDEIYKYFCRVHSGRHDEIGRSYRRLLASDKIFMLHDAALAHKTSEFLYAKAGKRIVDSLGKPVKMLH